jgi:hypothetical protein
MIDCSKYYFLRTGGKKQELVLAPDNNYCNDDELSLLQGKLKPICTPVFIPHMGRDLHDVVYCSNATKIYSDRFLQILRDNQFTGWGSYPVIIYDRKGNKIDNYSGLIITGEIGPFIWWRSPTVERKRPGGRFLLWKGHFFEEADSTDLLLTHNGLGLIVTKRVKEALEAAKITNVRFECCTETERIYSYTENGVRMSAQRLD